MELPHLLMAVTTPEPLRTAIHDLRDQLFSSMNAEQKQMMIDLEDLYTLEDLEHLTAAHKLLTA
jgi:hypothetical protein